MKKLLFTFLLFTFVVTAQKNMPVGMHYVTVESSDANELIELEKNYFSKLHKNAIDNSDSGNISLLSPPKLDSKDGCKCTYKKVV